MTEPRVMAVRTAPKASPLLEALAVTLHDGRPGFAARFTDVRQVDGAARQAEPWWQRGARRADNAVVVLDLDELRPDG